MTILQKTPDKDFIILNLTDPQMSDDEWTDGHKHKEIIINTVNTLIKRVRPDIITITGDLAESNNFYSMNEFAKLIDGFNIPWAPVLGNHDSLHGQESVDHAVKLLSHYKNCLFESGPKHLGNGNYVIAINEGEKAVCALIMMDTHSQTDTLWNDGNIHKDWGKLSPSQVEWYCNTVNELKLTGYLDNAVFIHIPIFAYREAMTSAYNTQKVPFLDTSIEYSYGEECWNEGYKDSFGVCWNEWVASNETDDFMLDAILNCGTTKHIVCGHDHDNNFVIKHKGIKFIYSTKTGAGHSWYPELNGGTVLTVDKNGISSVRHEYVKDYIGE